MAFVALLAMLMAVADLALADVSLSNVGPSWSDAHATFYGDISGGETMR